MAYDYGYGPLENELIDLLRTGAPNFAVAEKLIAKGADINAVGRREGENVLAEILSGYWWSKESPACDWCENRGECNSCEHNIDCNPDCGKSMIKIIRFFLEHGFDVHKQNDCFGARCLWELTLATHDRYMVDAIKLLLDAGAKNRTISERGRETPFEFVGTECGYQGTCENDYHTFNIYEAAYQVYLAAEEGRSYSGIDVYESAYGKQITKVLAEQPETGEVFYNLDLPEYKHKNCFNETLYFVYDGGFLTITQYGEFWTDTILPDKKMVDVSGRFTDIVGYTIEEISFEHSEIRKGSIRYSRPITTVKMSSGVDIIFGMNFGEVKEENRAAYYSLRPDTTYRDKLMRIYLDDGFSREELFEMIAPMEGKSQKEKEQIAKQLLEERGIQ